MSKYNYLVHAFSKELGCSKKKQNNIKSRAALLAIALVGGMISYSVWAAPETLIQSQSTVNNTVIVNNVTQSSHEFNLIKINRKDPRVDENKKVLARQQIEIKNQGEQVGQLKGEVSGHKNVLTGHTTHLNKLDQTTAKNQSRLAQHDKQLGEIDQTIASGEVRFNDLEQAFNQHSRETQSISHDVMQYQQDLAQQNQRLDGLSNELHKQRKLIDQALDQAAIAQAIAGMPQATQGRANIAIGAAYNSGSQGVAVGMSKNFGSLDQHTVKLSIGVAGSENAASVGYGYEF